MAKSFPSDNYPDYKQRITSFLFPKFTKQPQKLKRTPLSTIRSSKQLSLMTHTSNVAKYSKPTSKLHLSYKINIASMCTATWLLSTGAGVNLVKPALLPPQCTDRFKRVDASSSHCNPKPTLHEMKHSSPTSVSVTYVLEYGSTSFILKPSICFLETILLVTLYKESSQPSV